jgi:hypothetical protein
MQSQRALFSEAASPPQQSEHYSETTFFSLKHLLMCFNCLKSYFTSAQILNPFFCSFLLGSEAERGLTKTEFKKKKKSK